tara:strand:- start:1297 stop:2646 length:1350 start_codon:yes stop_codon:yes gene_type:complete
MKLNDIGSAQLKVLSYVKKYIKRAYESGVNVSNSSICYFHNYGELPGSGKLKFKFYGYSYFLSYLKILLVNILSISNLKDYKILHKKSENKYKFIIISNVNKKNFLKDGSYFDTYFQINSKKFKNTLFFLNSTDNYLPKKFDDNLIVIGREKLGFQLHPVYFFKIFIKNIIKTRCNYKKFFHEFSFLSQLSNMISTKVSEVLQSGSFKKVISFYEAQPYQNSLFHNIKKNYPNIKTIGYYHTALLPLHSSLTYRPGAPDLVLISGNYQKKYLIKYLGWPKKKVKSISSFRHKKESIKNMHGYIFLPYNFVKPYEILEKLKKFFENRKIKSLNPLKIRNHPHATNSKKHLKLIQKIKILLKVYKDRFSFNKSKKESIFIGSTTSIILSLEAGINVIHICEDPVLDSYNNKLWSNLEIYRIHESAFRYRLKSNKNVIKFFDKRNNIKKYLN